MNQLSTIRLDLELLSRPAVALTLVVLVHLGVFAALISWRVAPVPRPTTAVMIEVIRVTPDVQKTPEITPPKPAIKPPKPKSRSRPQPAIAAPVPATESPAPTALAEAPKIAQPVALPPIQTSAPIQVAQTAPRFDADYLDNPAPSYPPLSRRLGEEGKVVLRVFVESSGLPSRVEVRTSSGFERLDKSAVVAVGRWKFIPARLGTEVVGAWVLVPIIFSLKA